MLKHPLLELGGCGDAGQPPSGGCVLNRAKICTHIVPIGQPPSGGCVLKQLQPGQGRGLLQRSRLRAACVLKQNPHVLSGRVASQPPSGGCVLKHSRPKWVYLQPDAAAFGRLCVETITPFVFEDELVRSRLRAAVC